MLPTYALDTDSVGWVPTSPGLSFKPLAFLPGNAGWVQLLKLEPGTLIPRHRHTGDVHALNLQGSRRILDTDELIEPLTYVHENAGDVDSWMAVGDEPCIIYVEVNGTVEYLGDDDEPALVVDAALQQALYRGWCDEHGVKPLPALAG